MKFLDGYTIVDGVADGFWEDLREQGFTDDQMHFVIDLGLVEYITKQYVPNTRKEMLDDPNIPDEISRFELSDPGKDLVKKKE